MQEYHFKTEISDLSVSVFLFDNSFRLQPKNAPRTALMQMRAFHQHSTYELFYTPDLLTVVTENGRQQYRNAVVIIPPHFQHYVIYDHQDGFGLNFSFSPLLKKPSALPQQLEEKLADRIASLPIDEGELFYLSRLALCLEGEIPREQADFLVALLFSDLFHRLVPKEAPKKESSKHTRYINIIDHYISLHYCENIHLSDLAEQLYLCPRQISRILQKEYGASLSKLVHQKRLCAGQMLLKHTDLPIGEIARELGYDYESYFFTRFRAEYGITPTEFREQNK